MTPLIIDLSHYNIIPEDLTRAKADGVIGVIHKASQGSSIQDAKYPARRALARQAGLLWGAYHLLTKDNADSQMDLFLKTVQGDLPCLLAVDYEMVGVSLPMLYAFLHRIEDRTGQLPVLYSGFLLKQNLIHADEYLSRARLWLADYGEDYTLPLGWTSFFLRQYTDKGEVPGITGNVDLNEGNEVEVRRLWTGPPSGEVVLTVPKGTPYRVVEV